MKNITRSCSTAQWLFRSVLTTVIVLAVSVLLTCIYTLTQAIAAAAEALDYSARMVCRCLLDIWTTDLLQKKSAGRR